MKRVRARIALAFAAAGIVAAVAGTASAQRVCVDLVIQINDQGTAQHVCLPE
jgi:branched-subunit amino acid ABC-type transport system permease component